MLYARCVRGSIETASVESYRGFDEVLREMLNCSVQAIVNKNMTSGDADKRLRDLDIYSRREIGMQDCAGNVMANQCANRNSLPTL